MPSTSRSTHRPAFHRPSIAAVQPSATTLPAAAGQVLERVRQPEIAVVQHQRSPASAQVRQPAWTLRSLPGQVDGAGAGGAPGAIIHRPVGATASVRSGRTPSGPPTVIVAPHLQQHAGHHPVRAVDALDLPGRRRRPSPSRVGSSSVAHPGGAEERLHVAGHRPRRPRRHRRAAPSWCRRRAV